MRVLTKTGLTSAVNVPSHTPEHNITGSFLTMLNVEYILMCTWMLPVNPTQPLVLFLYNSTKITELAINDIISNKNPEAASFYTILSITLVLALSVVLVIYAFSLHISTNDTTGHILLICKASSCLCD